MAAANYDYLLYPTSPLVYGTGRPLDFGIGGETLAFPFPTTVAGAVRAAVTAKDGGVPNPYGGRGEVMLGLSGLARTGPHLTPGRMPDNTLLLPRPADAAYINGHVIPLVPKRIPLGSYTDLPRGLDILGLANPSSEKSQDAPPWWTAEDYSAWLSQPAITRLPEPNGRYRGDAGTDQVERTHVVMDRAGGKGAVEGGLFRSAGQDAAFRKGHDGDFHEYALAIKTTAEGLHYEARRFGGEGRFVRFVRSALTLPKKPQGLANAKTVRFILTTPAVFEDHGWYPDTFSEDGATGRQYGVINGVEVTLLAAAIARAQSYSGWQPDASGRKGGPGKPRRVVPAGSVYWFEVLKGNPEHLWEQSLCRDQWQRDGWGLGLAGLGSGAV